MSHISQIAPLSQMTNFSEDNPDIPKDDPGIPEDDPDIPDVAHIPDGPAITDDQRLRR